MPSPFTIAANGTGVAEGGTVVFVAVGELEGDEVANLCVVAT